MVFVGPEYNCTALHVFDDLIKLSAYSTLSAPINNFQLHSKDFLKIQELNPGLRSIPFGHPNWRHMLYSNNCLSSDNLPLFAIAHVRVGLDGIEVSTSALQLEYGKAVTVDCSPARLVLGTATKNWYNL